VLETIAEVQTRIEQGERLALAGSELALSLLPNGEWIGGTTPYFMDSKGGVCSQTHIFVTPMPAEATDIKVAYYPPDRLSNLFEEAPEHGYTFVIIPGGGTTHVSYSQAAPLYEPAPAKPVVGWIAGVHLSQVGEQPPLVFDGLSGQSYTDAAVTLHVGLPPHRAVHLDVLNLFKIGSGDSFMFPSSGFSAKECLINGRRTNFASYIRKIKPDALVPLMADSHNHLVNVSIQGVDEATGAIHFYAPVFAGVEYRFAEPLPDYVSQFEAAIAERAPAFFSCNCVLNYTYADLEGKALGPIAGPVAFGEIAQQLLNQTLVQLRIQDVSPRLGGVQDTSLIAVGERR
jgi:hypothetical protein